MVLQVSSYLLEVLSSHPLPLIRLPHLDGEGHRCSSSLFSLEMSSRKPPCQNSSQAAGASSL
uniref:Uncharacterized protein n=1 Tax=Oryza meridionalis TaxID=40149 RepID=A0A0E0CNJ3_9ORYZ